jgi:hypothetical protein
MTTYVQLVTPNVNVPGYSGGCLQYVDDGVNPPNRQPTAQRSWDYAVQTGVAHPNEEPPNNVWVPVYYSIDNGQWAGYGHVAWYYSDGKTTKIYDSEYVAGVRSAPYSSGAELFQHMGWQMRYYGWSEAVDGLRIVKPKPQEEKPKPETKKESKKMTVLTTEKSNYILTNDGYMTWIPKDEITVAFKKIYPTVTMKDVDARNMFLLLKNKK